MTCNECPDDVCPTLVDRWQRGDAQASNQLVAVLRSRLQPTLQQMLRNDDDAEDALQAALIKLFSRLEQWQQQCPLCLFFRVIAVREAINILRWRKRNHTSSLPENDNLVGPSGRSTTATSTTARSATAPEMAVWLQDLDAEIADCMQQKIAHFPPRSLQIVRQLAAGRTRREIAADLQVTTQALSPAIMKMEAALKECLEPSKI